MTTTKKTPPMHIIEIDLGGSPAWLLRSGLCTRQRADAHRWGLTEAHAYAAVHLDPAVVRHVRRVRP